MKKLWIVLLVAAAVLAAAGFAAYRLLSGGEEALGGVRAVVPRDALWYAEADELRAVWQGLRATEAWGDLEESLLVGRILDDALVQGLLEQVREVSERIDYPLDDENLMKFLGSELGLAVRLDAEAGEPEALLATRLDTGALRRDFLLGDADGDALRDELERRAQAAELSVAREALPSGDELSVLSLPNTEGRELWAVLLDDVLCLATSRRYAVDAVTTLREAATTSLAELPEFRAELAALPDDRFGFDWIGFDALRREREALAAAVGAEQQAVVAALDGVLAAVACPALARSWSLPDGDLYRATWTWSRTKPEVFAGLETPPLSVALADEPLFASEVLDAVGPLDALRASPTWERLAAAPWFEWIDEVGAEELGGQALASSTRFERRFVGRVLAQQLRSVFEGQGAVCVTAGAPSASGGPPLEVCGALRLGIDGLLFAEALLAAFPIGTDEVEAVEIAGHRGVRVSAPNGTALTFALRGDLWLFGTDGALQEALARDAAHDALAAARARFEPGYQAFGFCDLAAIQSWVGTWLDPEAADAFRALERWLPPTVSGVVRVLPGMERVELEMLSTLPPDGLPAPPAARRPGAFAELLPAETIAAAEVRVGLSDVLAMVVDLAETSGGPSARDEIDEVLAQVSAFLGVDVPSELLPALGPTVCYTYAYSDVAVQDLGGAPLPGFLLAIEVGTEEPVQRAIDAIFDAGNEQLAADEAPLRLVDLGDRIVLEGEPGVLPVRPSLGVLEGFLVLASDDAHVQRLLEVRDGTHAPLVRTPAYRRAHELARPADAEAWSYLAWDPMLSQLGHYGALVAQVVPPDAFPEYPEDGDEEEWERRIAAWQESREAAAAALTERVAEGLESARILDFTASVVHREPDALRTRMIVAFADGAEAGSGPAEEQD